MVNRQERLLRMAFLLGAITDALALLPMLIPRMAKLLWGFEGTSGACQFAMGYGATLMAAWRAVPTGCLQAGLISIFALAYHYPVVTHFRRTMSQHVR